jgi:hypothetical protein
LKRIHGEISVRIENNELAVNEKIQHMKRMIYDND